MAQFVLIHGGQHGAWCWQLLEAELGRLGHETFAMDMPIDQAGLFVDDYAKTVVAHVAGQVGEGAFLVGHSMGGLIAPRVAVALPSARIIFLCAGFAHTSEAERQENLAAVANTGFFDRLAIDALGRATISRENALAAFYHDVPPDLADWAVRQLRPQWAKGYTDVGPIAPYTDRIAGIIDCADDRILLAEPHRKIAEARFGITPTLLPGSHSPFLSRPVELAAALDRVAAAD